MVRNEKTFSRGEGQESKAAGEAKDMRPGADPQGRVLERRAKGLQSLGGEFYGAPGDSGETDAQGGRKGSHCGTRVEVLQLG